MTYTPKEINTFAEIQAATVRTGLPILIAVLRHLHGYYPDFIEKSILLQDIKADKGLEHVGYEIADERIIYRTIENLKEKQFVEETAEPREHNGILEKVNVIRLTGLGQEAVKLLRITKPD